MDVLIETLALIGCLSYAPPIVLIGNFKEIGGIEFEPWLTSPSCHALRNMHVGQLV